MINFTEELKKRIAKMDESIASAAVAATAAKMHEDVVKQEVETVLKEVPLAVRVGKLAADTCEMMISQRMDKAVLIGIKYAALHLNVEESFAAEAFAQAIKNNLPSVITCSLEEAVS